MTRLGRDRARDLAQAARSRAEAARRGGATLPKPGPALGPGTTAQPVNSQGPADPEQRDGMRTRSKHFEPSQPGLGAVSGLAQREARLHRLLDDPALERRHVGVTPSRVGPLCALAAPDRAVSTGFHVHACSALTQPASMRPRDHAHPAWPSPSPLTLKPNCSRATQHQQGDRASHTRGARRPRPVPRLHRIHTLWAVTHEACRTSAASTEACARSQRSRPRRPPPDRPGLSPRSRLHPVTHATAAWRSARCTTATGFAGKERPSSEEHASRRRDRRLGGSSVAIELVPGPSWRVSH